MFLIIVYLVVVMFKVTPSEISEILFEDLPDALASSDASDLEDDEEVVPPIDKLIENNFDRTFNSLIGNVSSIVGLTDLDEEGTGEMSEIDQGDQDESNQIDLGLGLEDPGLGTSSTVRPIDEVAQDQPGPSKPAGKVVTNRPRPTLKIKAKPKDISIKQKKTVGVKEKLTKRQTEERARAWKKNLPTCLIHLTIKMKVREDFCMIKVF